MSETCAPASPSREFPSLSGFEEASLYHSVGEYGFFALLWPRDGSMAAKLPRTAAQGRPMVQRSYLLRQMPQIIETLDQTRDTWLSQAEFIQPNRRVVNLLRLGLCFIDIDYYKSPWKTCTPDAMVNILRGYCQDEGIPEPSLILFSGRGLQIKWLFERPIPRAALPRWNVVQSRLVGYLERFGADRGARDASRLLRLVDTVNTRSGERVRVLWVNETQGEIIHYGFDYFCECVHVSRQSAGREHYTWKNRRTLPFRIPAGRRFDKASQLYLQRVAGANLAWDRLEDLRTLAQLRGWMTAGIPHGYRSKYIHWCLNFLLLSGTIRSNQLFYEAQALAREVCPDFAKDKDVRSVLSTLYRKAQAYEAGERIQFHKRRYPPLYTPRNSTLMELFDIADAEMRQLRTIITEEEARARHAERERLRRQHAGAVDRATYLETAEQRRVEARLRSAKGESLRQIAEALGVSIDTVKTYLYR